MYINIYKPVNSCFRARSGVSEVSESSEKVILQRWPLKEVPGTMYSTFFCLIISSFASLVQLLVIFEKTTS